MPSKRNNTNIAATTKRRIKSKTFFVCPETGDLFQSEKAALENAEKIIAKREKNQKTEEELEYQRNWVRLNVERVDDIPKLIMQKAKEFWDIECSISMAVRFGDVGNSHGCPIGKKTNWGNKDPKYPRSFPGWSGRVQGTITSIPRKLRNKGFLESISDYLFDGWGFRKTGFAGFHTGTGCPGTPYELNMSIGFYFFLEDFPKLVESHKIYLENKQKEDKYIEALNKIRNDALTFAQNHDEVAKLKSEIERLSKQQYSLQNKAREEYEKKHEIKKPDLVSNMEELEKTFGDMFKL